MWDFNFEFLLSGEEGVISNLLSKEGIKFFLDVSIFLWLGIFILWLV
jgi:hypothetical protein